MPNSPERTPELDPRRRAVVFGAVLLAALVVACLYVARAAQLEHEVTLLQPAAHPLTIAEVRARPHVGFLVANGASDRRLAFAPLDDPSQRVLTDEFCARFHYSHGAGVALGGPHAPGGAWFLDAGLKKTRAVTLPGLPSRARVSPDGKRAAVTLFVTGDAYDALGFSTRTYVTDLSERAARPVDLEDYALLRDGRAIDAPDVNYWGVTFPRDGTHFFATVQTGGSRYLVRGDMTAREAVVVHDDVECPSLSPDGKTIAFKRRVPSGSGFEWRLALLELAAGVVRHLEAEQRHVDDQVEWLDDAHLLYAVRRPGAGALPASDVWRVATDDRSSPVLFLSDASSPAVVRD